MVWRTTILGIRLLRLFKIKDSKQVFKPVLIPHERRSDHVDAVLAGQKPKGWPVPSQKTTALSFTYVHTHRIPRHPWRFITLCTEVRRDKAWQQQV